MKDLFSRCTYVCTYVSVMLRNIYLRLHSECKFALMVRNLSVADTYITCGTSMEDGEDSSAGPSQHTYLSQVHRHADTCQCILLVL